MGIKIIMDKIPSLQNPIVEASLLVIQNSKGEKLLEIPLKKGPYGNQMDYTPEELFALIAKQTRSYWGEQIAREIEQHCIDIGHWHEPNMPCQVHERAAAIARGNKE